MSPTTTAGLPPVIPCASGTWICRMSHWSGDKLSSSAAGAWGRSPDGGPEGASPSGPEVVEPSGVVRGGRRALDLRVGPQAGREGRVVAARGQHADLVVVGHDAAAGGGHRPPCVRGARGALEEDEVGLAGAGRPRRPRKRRRGCDEAGGDDGTGDDGTSDDEALGPPREFLHVLLRPDSITCRDHGSGADANPDG